MPNAEQIKQTLQRPEVLFGLLVLLLSYLTYFQNYAYPPSVFWDENYHIASAQKYLNGIYFMEPHPPMGKLLIAFGEKLLHPNPNTSEYISTDYARDFPKGFSFAGFRFFPTFLAWLTAPVLYGIFLVLTKKPHYAILLSFLYVFDNALIVHSRGAMLDSTLLFFCALTILMFLLLLQWKDHPRNFAVGSALFGLAFAGVMTTKANGLILILLLPFLLWKLWPDMRKIRSFLGIAAAAFVLLYCTVWYIHFSLAMTVNPELPDNGYYQASPAYQQILDSGMTKTLGAFPVMLRDNLKFMTHYTRGVPRLDLCKRDENGSPFYFWPLGARSINFRWETPEGTYYRYLYLQVNPAIWWMSSLSVLVGFCLLLASLILPLQKPLKYRFLLTTFLTLYACYMIAMIPVQRVLYLYHYFVPLLFSFIILGIVFLEIDGFARWKFTEQGKKVVLLLFGLFVFFVYQFYRPLTYYQPLTDEQFKRRAFFPLWELTCVKCEKVNSLAIPTK